MLNGLLEKGTCAACKICCGFDNTDLWELPVMNEKTVKKLLSLDPNVKFKKQNGGYVTEAGYLNDDELFYCPALDRKSGCTLGSDKPFDCLIWPFRIMESPDKHLRMITVSPVCPEIYNMPLSRLSEFVNKDFKKTVFDYAEQHPEIIKEYISGYPVLAISEAI